MSRLVKHCSLHPKELPWHIECPYCENRELRERIEELEILNDLLTARGKCHIITDQQIDAAWSVANNPGFTNAVREGAKMALRELGIVRCEGCEDSLKPGTVFKMDMGERGYITDCPDCDGHGWVKND